MLPGFELAHCQGLAVPADVMHHVVRVESAFNPFAIGVVGGRLARQPRSLAEALSTVRMLLRGGHNFSVGLAQVNRYNLVRTGLDSFERAFSACPNVQAGARLLADCHARADGDWGKAFSCYYSGNFTTGFRDGYVAKVFASMAQGGVAPTDARATPRPRGPERVASVPSRTRQVSRIALPVDTGSGPTAVPGGTANSTPAPGAFDPARVF